MFKMKNILMVCLLLLYGCGDAIDYTAGGTGTGTGSGSSSTTYTVTVASSPTTITTQGTASITATVVDPSSANIADGTVVTFSLSDNNLGSITSTSTTSGGVATAAFSAGSSSGAVTITATAAGYTGTTTLTISAASTGSIEFTSAKPQVIGIKGSGQTIVSTVTFAIKDVNGDPVEDGISVSFNMTGPSGGTLPSAGGEYIGDLDDSPTTATSSTVNGNATVVLHSGTVAGPCTIIASVSLTGGATISSSTSQISIGGGLASDTHFSLATNKFNLEGLGWFNITADISAYLADRFGNYNVLNGTSVSFYAEAGAIDRSDVTDESGALTVSFRTQNPMPADVEIDAWEQALITGLNARYPSTLSLANDGSDGHPRDGWVTILAAVRGEETFSDANANGLYDSGETYTDIGEPFYDKNDDGARDDGTSDPFEEFVDTNGNGSYNGPDGSWSSDITIWEDINVVFTGSPKYIVIEPTTFDINAGNFQTFNVMVADKNLNTLIAGTKITVTATKGTLAGTTTLTLGDVLSTGPTEFSFTLAAASTFTTDEPSTIKVEVVHKDSTYSTSINGMVEQ